MARFQPPAWSISTNCIENNTMILGTKRKSGRGRARPASPEHRLESARLVAKARSILEGEEETLLWFLDEVRSDVSAYLLSSCWRNRTRQLAEDVVEEVFAECFGGFARSGRNANRTPLLLRYKGEASLPTWLKRVARNRLLSRMRSMEERLRFFPEPNDTFCCKEPRGGNRSRTGSESPFAATTAVDSRHHPLRSAMAAAIREIEGERQEDLVLLKLHYLHGVAKNRLALAWSVEPCTIGRRIERVSLEIRCKAKAHLPASTSAIRYGVEDFLEAGCEAVLASHAEPIRNFEAKGAASR